MCTFVFLVYIYIYIYIYIECNLIPGQKWKELTQVSISYRALPICAILIGAQTWYNLIYTNHLLVEITSMSALARTPTRGNIMCIAEQLSWVLRWLTMHIWHDRKVHWWPLLGLLSMLHSPLSGCCGTWVPADISGTQSMNQLQCPMQCPKLEWLHASWQWHGGPNAGHQRELTVAIMQLVYSFSWFAPCLMFEFMYDVTTAINFF